MSWLDHPPPEHRRHKMESDILTMLLNIPSNDLLCQFCHNALDEQIGKTNANLGQINNDVDWSEEDQRMARKYIQNIFKHAALNENFDISEALKELGGDKINCVEECYNTRRNELMRKLQEELLARSERPVVTDFDWKIKWIVGSSSLSSIREPVVQVDLHTLKINEDNEKITDTVQFEMNLVEFRRFKEKLEAVKLNES